MAPANSRWPNSSRPPSRSRARALSSRTISPIPLLDAGSARALARAARRFSCIRMARRCGAARRLRNRTSPTRIEAIGRDGESAFYEGDIAAKIVASVRAAGGHMTLDDLKSYRAVEREPVRGSYRGHEIVSMPPPSSGGVHVIELLNILEGFPLADLGANSAANFHVFAEAMKLAYADRAQYLGDPDQVSIPVRGLISKAYAARLRAGISLERARPAAEINPLDPEPYESDQTTHFSIVDADGNAVANTYTLNFSYGLGLVAEGTGILLNNELDDFAAKPGAPNAFGLRWRRGQRAGAAQAAALVDGADDDVSRRRTGACHRLAGRLADHYDRDGDHSSTSSISDEHRRGDCRAAHASSGRARPAEVERGVSPDTIRLLEALGHKVVERDAWGSAQSILRGNGVLMGAADTRQRDTLATGY